MADGEEDVSDVTYTEGAAGTGIAGPVAISAGEVLKAIVNEISQVLKAMNVPFITIHHKDTEVKIGLLHLYLGAVGTCVAIIAYDESLDDSSPSKNSQLARFARNFLNKLRPMYWVGSMFGIVGGGMGSVGTGTGGFMGWLRGLFWDQEMHPIGLDDQGLEEKADEWEELDQYRLKENIKTLMNNNTNTLDDLEPWMKSHYMNIAFEHLPKIQKEYLLQFIVDYAQWHYQQVVAAWENVQSSGVMPGIGIDPKYYRNLGFIIEYVGKDPSSRNITSEPDLNNYKKAYTSETSGGAE
jgi:hypothetical protein